MPLAALGLLLAAAVMHVGWNVLLKTSADRTVLSWAALAAGALLALPVALTRPALDAAAWRLAGLSAVVEAAYFLLLVRGYRHDFSQLYPIARGTAPVLLAAWSALLVHERPGPAGAAGILLVAAGVVVVGGTRTRGHGRAVGLALAVALCTSLYSLVDGIAVRRADPVAYNGAVFALSALVLAPAAWRKGAPATLAALARLGWRVPLAGLLSFGAYALVLFAFRLAPLAYAAAGREVSVVLAAFVGWRWMGERFGPVRVAGSVVVFGGILLLAADR